jgi:iron-sulfur cluster repair protein YtfE (RIC family)
MTHACSCQDPKARRVELGTPPSVTPDLRVDEVARDPRALAVLQQMGINHCCGAHLTLKEAAAAAGVSIETLLGALRDLEGAAA